jgi:outer membrane protein OmpA-like peptidoglycan-associated protein
MEQSLVRSKVGLVACVVILGGVSACSSVPDVVNPVSWYRDATGVSKNDDLGKGQNENNLEEGSNEPYPNLANVPEAPSNALSGVDRDKLVSSLAADRDNAKYSDDDLHAGRVTSTVPPPVPSGANTVTATRGGATAPAAAPTSAVPAPVAPAPAPPPAPIAASPVPPPPEPVPQRQQAQRRAPARGSEAPPAESTLRAPTVRNVPQGEESTPAPPAPRLTPPGQVASAGSSGARAPALTPPGQPASAPASKRPGISYRVAEISFATGSAFLSGALRGTVAEIVKIHNESGGMIRIVGHGEATGKDAAMAGLTLALDRAQAVAVALTDSGIPAKDIAVEAAPVLAKGGADAPRAEVYIEN